MKGGGHVKIKSPSLLAGLIVDEQGEPLVATHACKGNVRYRHYVSRALQHEPDEALANAMRIPAREIEAAVIERIAEELDDPLALLETQGSLRRPMSSARPSSTRKSWHARCATWISW